MPWFFLTWALIQAAAWLSRYSSACAARRPRRILPAAPCLHTAQSPAAADCVSCCACSEGYRWWNPAHRANHGRQPLKDTVPVHVQQRPDNPASPVDDPSFQRPLPGTDCFRRIVSTWSPAVVGYRDFHGTEAAASRTSICRTSVPNRQPPSAQSPSCRSGFAGPVSPFPVQGLLQCLMAQKSPASSSDIPFSAARPRIYLLGYDRGT